MLSFSSVRWSVVDLPSLPPAWASDIFIWGRVRLSIIRSYTFPMLLDTVIPLSLEHFPFFPFPLDSRVISPSRLDDGSRIAETLCQHHANWHKTCFVMCNQTKVERAKKRKTKSQMLELPNTPIQSKLRASLTTLNVTAETEGTQSPNCFFCDQTVACDAHTCTCTPATANLDENVRSIATKLRDWTLLAKLSSSCTVDIDHTCTYE